jgi:transposase
VTSLDDVPLSVLDLVPVTSGARAAQALRRTVNLAQHAEQLGFHRYRIAEHHNLRTSAAAATPVVVGQVAEQLHTHADAHVFTSLPRAGTVRAARLLAEIGDARGRFPTPEALASLAGVAASTRQSGRAHVVGFRWAVDRQLRDALVEWAGDSRLSNPWAADLYKRARARGHDHPHAVRVLARDWVYAIWRCWQDHTAYDPTRHGGCQRLLELGSSGILDADHRASVVAVAE